MKSLIVEDEFTSRMQIKYFLEKYGPCDTVVNGSEAVKAFKMAIAVRQPYDLICLDIKLPEKNGHQVLEEIREIEKNMDPLRAKPAKIFMTTAMADADNVGETLGLCNEYLLKPVGREMLDQKLRKHRLV